MSASLLRQAAAQTARRHKCRSETAGSPRSTFSKGRACNEGALRHDGRRDATAQPGASDVRAEPGEGPLDGQRERRCLTHETFPNVLYLIQ